MAKAKKCSKCDEPAMPDRDICKEHFAEYMRDYRKREDKKRDQENHIRGFEEGIRRCVAVLRSKVGSRSMDGFTAAYMLEKAGLSSEVPGVAERQKLIESMRPWH